ncbi:tRNA lysidine(34) synthetase TilS [Sphingomonas sp. GCM10030256]|uniref:tRNA lysidine(34) synthetase TilS n=1 Tax=Sphingomonas sp. GCM10030256 TaxID=3273427 RepID=UPI00361CCCB7
MLPLERFNRDLTRLLSPGGRIGIAVSGGPDSLALLLLAAAARPGEIEAATVDHGLRHDSADEARFVARVCAERTIPHAVLPVRVEPGASLQARAREVRYAALAKWAHERRLAAILTAHHADDQAETLLLRLARGAGLAGLSSIRACSPLAGATVLRPLLSWRKSELEAIVEAAGLIPIRDPANHDPRHDRTAARKLLERTEWLQPARLAASAAHLAASEEALEFAAASMFSLRAEDRPSELLLTAADLPAELQRRLMLLAFVKLGAPPPRGPDLDRALAVLRSNGSCTLSGLQLSGGERWRIAPAPPRR